MKVAISVRVRNGHLAEAAKQFETQTAFAEWLEVPAYILSKWMNYSSPFWCKSEKYNPDIVAAKLELICGVSIEDIFPAEVYSNKEWLKRSKVVERVADLPIEQLIETGAMPALPPAPDELAELDQLREHLGKVLHTLTPRQEKVIRMRYGVGEDGPQTYEEIGQNLGVCASRARDIEARAMRLLRKPLRSRMLLEDIKGFKK